MNELYCHFAPLDNFRRISRIRVGLAGLMGLLMISIAPAVMAGQLDHVDVFHIDSQPLTRALLLFASQAHIQISIPSDAEMKGRKARAVEGSYVGRDALAMLLAGTDMGFLQQGGVVAIVPAKRWPESRGDSSALLPDEDSVRQRLNASPNQERENLEEVTVTGTRIEGVAPVGAPIKTLGQVQIRNSGFATLDQLLQSLSNSFRGGAAGATPDAAFSRGANSGYNGTFGSGVNLLGLGNNATLVLLDGHRIAPSGSGFYTDISAIPLSAIDHIDILTDGSSAVYGSDAIAGVVNIHLKKSADGLATGLRYGGAQGFSQYDANAEFGHQWSTGGFTLTSDYAGQSSLDVSARPFTSSISSPTNIFPMVHQAWVSVAGDQSVRDMLMLDGDFEYSDTRRLDTESYSKPAAQSIIDVPRWSAAVDARVHAGASWIVRLSLSAGEGVEQVTANNLPGSATVAFLDETREVSRFLSPSFGASGPLVALPGGKVRLAAGASYLEQAFSHSGRNVSGDQTYGAARHVSAGYGEIWIPLVSAGNSVPAISKLTLSAAGRYDRYSDFGSTKNYKIGLSWYPMPSLQLRGAYSTSFRAPAVGQELVDSNQGTTAVLVYPLLNTEETGKVPVLILAGAVPHLKPETATNLSLGVDYSPPQFAEARISLSYYHVIYQSRLISPPFEHSALGDPALAPVISSYASSAPVQALAASAVSGGAMYIDATGGAFGADPLASTLYAYDERIANLSRTETSGVTLGGVDSVTLGGSRFRSRVDVTYIRTFLSQLTAASAALQELNSVGYPARLQGSAQEAWSRGNMSVALTGHYVSGYTDTTAMPASHIGSYFTVNTVIGYRFSREVGALRGASMSLAVTNLLDREPPYVREGALYIPGSHYDAANANPLGRAISLELRKAW